MPRTMKVHLFYPAALAVRLLIERHKVNVKPGAPVHINPLIGPLAKQYYLMFRDFRDGEMAIVAEINQEDERYTERFLNQLLVCMPGILKDKRLSALANAMLANGLSLSYCSGLYEGNWLYASVEVVCKKEGCCMKRLYTCQGIPEEERVHRIPVTGTLEQMTEKIRRGKYVTEDV